MKRTNLCIAAMAAMLLSSCSMDVKDTTAKDVFLGYNLINPLDGGTPATNPSVYTVDMNVTKQTTTVASALIYNSNKYDFTSN